MHEAAAEQVRRDDQTARHRSGGREMIKAGIKDCSVPLTKRVPLTLTRNPNPPFNPQAAAIRDMTSQG